MSANPHCITDFDRAMPIETSKESWSCSALSVPMWKCSEEWQFRTTRHNGGSAYLLVTAHLVIYAVWSPVIVLGSQVVPDNRTSWNCAVLRLINLSDGTRLSREKIKSATRAAEQPSQLCWFTQKWCTPRGFHRLSRCSPSTGCFPFLYCSCWICALQIRSSAAVTRPV